VVSDFEPIALTVQFPSIIVSKNALPAKNLRELIEWLKDNPDKASAGTSGAGSIEHIGGLLFQNVTGTRFNFVPYQGAAPALLDLAAGHIDLIIENLVTSLPRVRDGNIKAFAVTTNTRSPAAPEIPTADEAGLPGFKVTSWLGLWAPRGTPKDVIAKLNSAVVTALADPTVRTRLADLGMEIFPRDQQTPEALAAYQKAEIDKRRYRDSRGFAWAHNRTEPSRPSLVRRRDWPSFPRSSRSSCSRLRTAANGAEGRHWADDQGGDRRPPGPNRLEWDRDVLARFLSRF
jgi:tripartite-type tricarboxylate transporter receptor subunit TctC